ncbi:MAG: AsmA family protein [Terracidiphilus sp.]
MRGRLRIALAAIAVLVLLLVVPPLISVNHYKGQITGLISQSLDRPVHLSSVQARLLPWPGFEITDLSVAEDPAYGAEPVLHADKVTASIRLLALWSGRLEIGKISVDDASLNLVRAAPGRWNLDPIFRTAAVQTGSAPGAQHVAPPPYLEATNSRINFKNGVEKLPFSLINADLSFWQENPGEWRVRLRGQPARTDVSLNQEETGVVRMEASVHRAPTLHQMPLHLDLDWREAQLGQLARLITGSDPGWRGDLTGELHLDGTADAAQIAMRLRASGVHRAEFTPASPLDFDARCGFVYHYSQRSLENLACDSPLGDGHVHITGEKPGEDAPPRFSVELDRIPVTAGLDALRTFRNGLAPDLETKGTVSGKIVYAADEAGNAAPLNAATPVKPGRNDSAKAAAEQHRPLTGSLTITDFALSGGGLSRPVQAAKITLEPVSSAPTRPQAAASDEPPVAEGAAQELAGTVTIPAGGSVPLTFSVSLSFSGYRVGVRGPASFARARELAHAAGIPESSALASLAGEPITVDLTAEGPWIPPEEISLSGVSAVEGSTSNAAESSASAAPMTATVAVSGADTLTGTITIHNANWKADYLANHIEISEGTLHLENGNLRWDPVDFSYGPVKGTASLTLPVNCPPDAAAQPCLTQFQLQFADLDAAALESALLGAREKGTMISNLIDRFHPSSAQPWPQVEGTIKTDSLILEPVTLQGVTAAVRILPGSVGITSLDGSLFGGAVHLAGTLTRPATDQDRPEYTLNGDFEKVNAADLGRLLGLRWTGGTVSGSGNVELSGYTDKDLAASAKGTVHFECRQGSIAAAKTANAGETTKPSPIPLALAHFDRWAGDASIANGAIRLGPNQVVSGARKRSVEAAITFGDPPRVSFPALKETPAEKRR